MILLREYWHEFTGCVRDNWTYWIRRERPGP